jgi:putative heme-binding domain-containing protein
VPRFDQLDGVQLVALLESPAGAVRDMAQQRLIELHDTSIVGELEKMARRGQRATARLHALCTLDGLKQLTADWAELLVACLADEHPAVRRHAIRLAEPLLDRSAELRTACLRLRDDSDAQVRQQLAYTLGECHDQESAQSLAILLMAHADDRLLAAAAVSSLHADNIAAVLDAIHRSHLAVRDDSSRGARGLRSNKEPLPESVLHPIIATAVGLDPKQGWRPVAKLLTAEQDAGYATWQLRAAGALDAALETHAANIGDLLANGGESAAAMGGLLAAAPRLAGDSAAPLEARVAAIRLLRVGNETDNSDGQLEKLVSPDAPLAVQTAAIALVGRRKSAALVDKLIADWNRYSPQIRSQIIDALLAQAMSSARLLDAIDQGQVQPSDLSTAQRDRLLRHRQGNVRQRAEKLLAHSIDRNRESVVERFSKLAVSAGSTAGDASRGLAVFEKRCATCHRWGDRGQEVGPDLAALTDRLPGTMLVSIFDPNRAVEAKYVSYTAITRQGLSHTGVLVQESDTSITIAKADGKREALLRSEIEELTSSGKSLMPEGLESELTEQDVADLLTFLSGSPDVR